MFLVLTSMSPLFLSFPCPDVTSSSVPPSSSPLCCAWESQGALGNTFTDDLGDDTLNVADFPPSERSLALFALRDVFVTRLSSEPDELLEQAIY